jgi:hypothetical protein
MPPHTYRLAQHELPPGMGAAGQHHEFYRSEPSTHGGCLRSESVARGVKGARRATWAAPRGVRAAPRLSGRDHPLIDRTQFGDAARDKRLFSADLISRVETSLEYRPVIRDDESVRGFEIHAHQAARPTLTEPEGRLHRPHRDSLRHGPQASFPTNSFKAWLSRVRSATNRFSRVFSCSSRRRRRPSLTSRPLYFAFQR